jgi:hypothetical protein
MAAMHDMLQAAWTSLMQDLFYTAPLLPSETHLAFPLVQMSDPSVTLRDWLAFARAWLRRKPEQGGLMAVRDRRGILHALYSYRVERSIRQEPRLHIGDLIVGRLPGADLDGAVLFGIQELSTRLSCASLLIDVPVPPDNACTVTCLGGPVGPSFAPAAVTFLRHSAESRC